MDKFRNRIADRSRWPRKLWRPLRSIDRRYRRLSPERRAEVHRATSLTVRKTLFAQIGFAFFCIFSLLGTPDRDLIADGATLSLPIPFVADYEMSFVGFLVMGPLVLLAITMYLHVFYRHLLDLDRIVPLEERVPFLFNLGAPRTMMLSSSLFYLVTPLTLWGFAYKAQPLPFFGPVLTWAAWASFLLFYAGFMRQSALPRSLGEEVAGVAVFAGCVVLIAFMAWTDPDFSRRKLNLKNADLTNQDLRDRQLRDANLYEAFLCGADLSRANLSGAFVVGAWLGGGAEAELPPLAPHLEQCKGAELSQADLTEAILAGANLVGANLANASLIRANLNGANLVEADLKGADLSGADLWLANLDTDLSVAIGLEETQLRESCIPADADPNYMPHGFSREGYYAAWPGECEELWGMSPPELPLSPTESE